MTNECVICKDQYTDEKVPFELECEHTFCKHCILDMFKRDNRCPLCRKEYTITIKLKEEGNFNSNLSPIVREAIRRLPVNNGTRDAIYMIEMLTFRISRRILRLIEAYHHPSCELIINDNTKMKFSIHTIVTIIITGCLWLLLYMFYR